MSNLDLRGVDFGQTSLSDINFSGADLRGAIFTDSVIADVNFSGAQLEGAVFTRSQMVNVIADEVDLKNVNLEHASLSFDSDVKKPIIRNLEMCEMTRTFLSWVDLSGQDLRNLNVGLGGAKFHDVNFSECNMEGANLSHAAFKNCDLSRCNLQDAHVEYVLFTGVTGVALKASGANFNSSMFMGDCTMSFSDFSGSKFAVREADGTSFEGCNFSNATMRATWSPHFRLCNFADSNFSGCDLGESNFSISGHTNYSGRKILTCFLSGIDWQNTNTKNIMLGEETVFKEKVYHYTPECFFEKYTLREACEKLNLSDKQFEFMVLSGALEVREEITNHIVRSGFDPDSHYVPVWAMQNFKVE